MESDLQPASRVVSSDPLENICALLSELPTESALRELNRGKSNGSVRKVIETMALHKNDLIGGIALLSRRENLAMKLLEMHYKIADLEKIDWSTVEITFHERKKD